MADRHCLRTNPKSPLEILYIHVRLDYSTYCMYIVYMPDIKVYLRADDTDKWNAIEKKAEWLHNALNAVPKGFAPLSTDKPAENISPVIKTPEDVDVYRLAQLTKGSKLCKIHGIPLDSRGKCLQKGCKYA